MSDLILPEYLSAPVIEDAPAVSEVEKQDNSIKAAQLPKPSGFKILCLVPSVEETFGDSAIVKASIAIKAEEQTTTVLFVLRLGPDAYKDTAKFPSGAWCAEGDFVLVRAYSGTRFKIHGKEFRMIYDDQVEGTVEDPRGYARAA